MLPIILNIFPFCNGVSHISLPSGPRGFAHPVHAGPLPGANWISPQKDSEKNTRPPAVPHAAGGLLLIRIFQWTVTSFPQVALGIRLKCTLPVSSNPWTLPEFPSFTNLPIRGASFGPDAYSSLFGTNQDCISLRVPNRQKLGLFVFLFFGILYCLVHWSHPFLSVCIVLYSLVVVNAFLVIF